MTEQPAPLSLDNIKETESAALATAHEYFIAQFLSFDISLFVHQSISSHIISSEIHKNWLNTWIHWSPCSLNWAQLELQK